MSTERDIGLGRAALEWPTQDDQIRQNNTHCEHDDREKGRRHYVKWQRFADCELTRITRDATTEIQTAVSDEPPDYGRCKYAANHNGECTTRD